LRRLVGLDVDEEEVGRARGHLAGDLLAEIALDLGDGGEGGQADAEGDHQDRRRRAGPVQVGEAEPQRRPAKVA
jgi:hypothetical protein